MIAILLLTKAQIASLRLHERRSLARLNMLPRIYGLSDRQRRIARLIAQGKSQKEVASALNLSVGTVKVYLPRGIYPRLGVSNRVGLMRYWMLNVEGYQQPEMR